MAWPRARPLAFLGPNRPPRFRRQYRASSLPAHAVNVSRHAGPPPATPQHGVMDTAGTVTRHPETGVDAAGVLGVATTNVDAAGVLAPRPFGPSARAREMRCCRPT